jgi:acetyl esterase/lipase
MSLNELTVIRQMLAARPPRDDISVVEMRALYEQFGGALPKAADIIRERIMIGAIPAEWSTAPGADPAKVILYLHGGGYVLGSITTHQAMVGELGRAFGGRCLAIDYRLAPEHAFPAAVDDAVAAYEFLLKGGIAPNKIVIAGDSAGGGLTLAALMAIREKGLPRPGAGFCISPWADLEGHGQSMVDKASVDPMVQRDGLLKMTEAYMAGGDPKSPLASPIHGSFKDLPPLLIHVGAAETLLDDSIQVARLAGAADVPVTLEIWPHMIHVWHFFAPMLSEAREAITNAGQWLNRQVS